MIIDFDSKNNGGGKFGAGLSGMKIRTNAQTIDLSNLDTSAFTDMSEMFSGCSSLTSLDLSHFDTNKATNMGDMFNMCSSLTSLDLSHFHTSNVENMRSMFYNVNNIKSLDLSNFDTSKVTNMGYMFSYCSSLKSLNISNFDTSKVTNMGYMFNYCKNLTTIISDGLQLPNIDMSNIRLNGSPKLTVDSIVGLLNALPQSDKGYSFQIGSDNIAKLSDEQKAIATNKGWTLV